MSTWGQLRFVLQTESPETALDLLDSYLNTRYTSVLSATDWIGRKGHVTIQSLAAYQSALDTVTFTVGSNLVAGVGTAWTNVVTGQNVYRPGDVASYIATWVSAVALTLDRPYQGTGGNPVGTVYAASPYVFSTDIYTLPADCDSIVTVLNPVNNLPMLPMTKDELDAASGTRTLIANPSAYCEYDDSAEPAPPANAPAVLHRIQFYPPPEYARGFVCEYLRNPYAFDGTNTSRSPLPFVSDLVILEGCRANIATGSEAIRHEGLFDRELQRLLLVEHARRRVKAPIQMADRFVRHRLARVARGYGNYRGMPNPPTSSP